MNVRFEIMCNLDFHDAESRAIDIEEHLYYLMEKMLGVDCAITTINADNDSEIL